VAVEQAAVGSNVNDVFERVLDNGIVIDNGLNDHDVEVSHLRYVLTQTDRLGIEYAVVVGPGGDDDDGGAGSSGVPAIDQAPLEPRRSPPSRPERTRRMTK
jgi:hypothetical protein